MLVKKTSVAEARSLCILYRRPEGLLHPCTPLLPIKVHRDERLYLNSFTVQNIRTITPLLDCIHGCLRQQRMSALHAQALDAAVLGDDGMQLHLTVDSGNLANLGVDGFNASHQRSRVHHRYVGGPKSWRPRRDTRVAFQRGTAHSVGIWWPRVVVR